MERHHEAKKVFVSIIFQNFYFLIQGVKCSTNNNRMKRKRQALEDGDEEAEISSQGDTAKQEEAAKNQKSRKKEINSTSRPQGSIKTKSQDNNTIGSSKKVREHDPERLWKRDRVCADFTSLQDQAGAGGVSPSKLEAGGKAQELSLDYLRQWKNDREHWKFLKVRQVWLLKHMFHKSKVWMNCQLHFSLEGRF